MKQFKFYFLTISFFFSFIILNAEDGDEFRSMQKTFEGNYLFGGTNIQEVEKQGAWLIKTDTSGNVLWSKTYCNFHQIVINAVKQTSDSGFICTGTYQINPGDDNNIFLLKTNHNGDSLWFETYGGSDDEVANDLEIADDGDFIVTGSKYTSANNWDIYLIKTNNEGAPIWAYTYGDSLDDDKGNACELTAAGEILITGQSQREAILLKLDTLGAALWSYTYIGFYGYESSTGYDLKSLSNGEIVVTGDSYGALAFILKTDSLGNEIWAKGIGHFGDNPDFVFKSVNKTTDKGFILSGRYFDWGHVDNNYSEFDAIFIAKADSNGDTVWTRDLYPTDDCCGYIGEEIDNGNFLIGGYSGGRYAMHGIDAYLCKIDPMGNSIWTRYYPEIPKIDTSVHTVQISAFIGDSSTKTFGIKNVGNDTLVIDSVKEKNPYVIDLISPSFPQSIPPQDSLLTTISLHPDSIIFYYDTLLVFSNDPFLDTLRIHLLGRGTGNILLSEYLHDFGNVQTYDTVCCWDFFAKNLSTDTLMIDSITNSTPVFWTDTLSFPQEIAPEDSIQIEVYFKPGYKAYCNDTLNIFTSDTLESRIEVFLSGTGYNSGVEERDDEKTDKKVNIKCSPNPFSNGLKIEYSLERSGNVQIMVFNILGQKLKTLVDAHQNRGQYSIDWDGTNDNGKTQSPGIYFLLTKVAEKQIVRKLIRIR